MTANDPGCSVRDEPGATCPGGLAFDEHRVVAGRLIHPVGLDRSGRWTWDEDLCHRTDGACSGRSCWVCEVKP